MPIIKCHHPCPSLPLFESSKRKCIVPITHLDFTHVISTSSSRNGGRFFKLLSIFCSPKSWNGECKEGQERHIGFGFKWPQDGKVPKLVALTVNGKLRWVIFIENLSDILSWMVSWQIKNYFVAMKLWATYIHFQKREKTWFFSYFFLHKYFPRLCADREDKGNELIYTFPC